MHSFPVRRLKDILNHVLPNITLISTEELKPFHLTRLFTLKMSDGSKLVMSFAPSLAVRLLRQESMILSTEAVLLKFIADSVARDQEEEEETQGKGKGAAGSLKPEDKNGDDIKEEDQDQDDDEEEDTKDDESKELLGLVPKLLKHSTNTHELAYPYTIIEHTPGELLSNMAPFLSVPERFDVDRQVGSMARKLADLTSPIDTFGMANAILPDPNRPASPRASPAIGCKTWSEGFNTLLEGILRDGEDMAVLLPYEVIRSHFHRLAWRLDAVTVPRLVILDVHDPKNIMIEREPDDEETMLPSEKFRVTGLRNWSQGVFGDPLVASCFEEPPRGFQEGWDEAGEEIVEDEENSETRLLLYRCYRSVVEIVTEYYRPKGDSSKRELAGRRKLTQVLADLEKVEVVEDNGPKRGWKYSTDAGTSKRVKTEAQDEHKYDGTKV